MPEPGAQGPGPNSAFFANLFRGRGPMLLPHDAEFVAAPAPERTVPEAVAAVVESYTRTRERHGGRDWKPAGAQALSTPDPAP